MAEASVSWAEDQFSCSVCLDLLVYPVTIPCGHTYCKRCISDCWDKEDWKGIYSCPQCRQTFSPRPVLGKNVVFAEMVEKLKKTKLQAAPCLLHAGSGDVQCDSCTEIKQRAVKSCLDCRSSYCQTHLKQHESLFKGKRHNLMDATGRLQEMICPQHDKMLEIYCCTDQQCICMLCLVDEHKNHDTVSTAVAMTEKRKNLEAKQRILQKIIHQREKDLQELRKAVESHKSLSSVSLSGSTDRFTVSSHPSFDVVVKSVSQLRDKLQQFSRETIENLYERVKTVQVILAPECQTRKEFLRYSRLLTLDLNSVNYLLRLSEENTVITATNTHQPYPDHPDRFDYWWQALCRESVTGCCYWEVEWTADGRLGVDISVAYKSIRRKGRAAEIEAGHNDQSWRLYCTPFCCSFWHKNIETVLPVTNVSRRIGVYVDHSAGVLSFYSVSDRMSLIHRVRTTFTQPLYAMFGLDLNSRVKLCRLTK